MTNTDKLARATFGSAMVALLGGCASAPGLQITDKYSQPDIVSASKPKIVEGGLRFKDLNVNGVVDPYEDWWLTPAERAEDLVSRMTLEEKAGTMLIASLNPACDVIAGVSRGRAAGCRLRCLHRSMRSGPSIPMLRAMARYPVAHCSPLPMVSAIAHSIANSAPRVAEKRSVIVGRGCTQFARSSVSGNR